MLLVLAFLFVSLIPTAFPSATHEEWLEEDPCNRLYWTFHEHLNNETIRQLESVLRINLLTESLLQPNTQQCWFRYKVDHAVAPLLLDDGRVLKAINHQVAASTSALSLATTSSIPNLDAITVAISLADLLHKTGISTSGVENSGIVAWETDLLWNKLQNISKRDRSLRIRGATHVPWMISSENDALQIYSNLSKKMEALAADPTMDCLNVGPNQCGSSPQNYTHWFPTYALHYHNMDARNNLDLTKKISSLYLHSTRSLNWVAPHLTGDYHQKQHERSKSKRNRIKVGFLSAFLRHDHSLGQHIRGVIDSLDRMEYQVILIHIGEIRSNQDLLVTKSIIDDNEEEEEDQDLFLPANLLQLANLRSAIASLQLNVLIYPEIGMEAHAYFLSFARLAPVQIATWGFPQSLSTKGIDFFVSSDDLEPDTTASFHHYDEQLVQFKKATPWFFYKEDAIVSSTNSKLQNNTSNFNPFQMNATERKSKHIYLIPQDPIKLHYTMDQMIEHLLEKDPQGIIAVQTPDDRGEYLKQRFEKINNRSRSKNSKDSRLNSRILYIPRLGRFQYLKMLSMADVVLDTWPWGGWTTTLQALAAHVPVITLPGYDARSRFTLGCYRTLNVSEFVARNIKEYVQIAIRAATNITWREEIMSRIDVVKHLLENDKTPIVWNNFLRRVVEQY